MPCKADYYRTNKIAHQKNNPKEAAHGKQLMIY
jgi:hypothetical protein